MLRMVAAYCNQETFHVSFLDNTYGEQELKIQPLGLLSNETQVHQQLSPIPVG